MDTKDKTRQLDKELTKRFSYEGMKPLEDKRDYKKRLFSKLKTPLIILALGAVLSLGVSFLSPDFYEQGHTIWKFALALPMVAGFSGIFTAFSDASSEYNMHMEAERKYFAMEQTPKISQWVNEHFPLMTDPEREKGSRKGNDYTFGYDSEIAKALRFETSKRSKGEATGFLKMLYKDRYSEEDLSKQERYLASGSISVGFIAHEEELEVIVKEFTYIYS